MQRKHQINRNEKLYCRTQLTYGRHSFEVGDVFPVKKIGANWRRVVDMFSGFQLINENDVCFDDVMKAKNARLGKTEEQKNKPNVRLKNKARGWYDVLVDGVVVNEVSLRKPAAEKLMGEL